MNASSNLYDKVNVHSTGVGLGLPLACKMAEAMDGHVALVSSEPGRGSHFRVEFWNPSLSCPISRPQQLNKRLDIELSKFHVLASNDHLATISHIRTFLVSRGLQESNDVSDLLAVLTSAKFNDEFDGLLREASKFVLSIAFIPAKIDQPALRLAHPNTLFFSGQFTSQRLEQILIEANDEFKFRKAQAAQKAVDASASQDEIDMPSRNHSVVQSEGNLRFHRPTSCLLVDDNAINLRIVSMFCEKRKYAYTTAEDGLQAIDAYKAAVNKRCPVDLVLLDLQMPNCDGIQACQEIRAFERIEGLWPAIIFISMSDKHEPLYHFANIIAVTGQDSVDDKGRCFAAGIDKYFVKPLPMKKLDDGIAEFFKST
jgi:CheY-like chemotaxis protein